MTHDQHFDLARLGTFIEKVREDPDAAQTVWRAETDWKQGLRSEATIRTHVIPMDEPQQLGGTDTAPNMVEVVLGAYGCCLTTGFVATAAMMGIELSDVRIGLEGDLDLRPFLGLASPHDVWPGFTSIRATIRLDSPTASQGELQKLYDAVVPTSPVGSILSRPIELVTTLATSSDAGT
ncbi:MAG: OsmC family protein [Pseudonocardia sp.]